MGQQQGEWHGLVVEVAPFYSSIGIVPSYSARPRQALGLHAAADWSWLGIGHDEQAWPLVRASICSIAVCPYHDFVAGIFSFGAASFSPPHAGLHPEAQGTRVAPSMNGPEAAAQDWLQVDSFTTSLGMWNQWRLSWANFSSFTSSRISFMWKKVNPKILLEEISALCRKRKEGKQQTHKKRKR